MPSPVPVPYSTLVDLGAIAQTLNLAAQEMAAAETMIGRFVDEHLASSRASISEEMLEQWSRDVDRRLEEEASDAS